MSNIPFPLLPFAVAEVAGLGGWGAGMLGGSGVGVMGGWGAGTLGGAEFVVPVPVEE